MRVNMDSSIATDPRFKLLAKRLGITWREAIGSCFLLWLSCYDRRSKCFDKLEADVAAELDGFADALVASKLATDNGDDTIDVHGVEKRIEFLKKQAKKGSAGGKKSGKSRASKSSKREAAPEANASAGPEANASDSAQAYTLAPALAPDLALERDTSSPAEPAPLSLVPEEAKPDPDAKARALARAGVEELRIGLGAGCRVQPDSKTALKLCKALAKDGATVEQMRRVVRAKLDEWRDDPKMRDRLVPSTLFAKDNWRKYLEEDVPRFEAKTASGVAPEDDPLERYYAEREAKGEAIW